MEGAPKSSSATPRRSSKPTSTPMLSKQREPTAQPWRTSHREGTRQRQQPPSRRRHTDSLSKQQPHTTVSTVGRASLRRRQRLHLRTSLRRRLRLHRLTSLRQRPLLPTKQAHSTQSGTCPRTHQTRARDYSRPSAKLRTAWSRRPSRRSGNSSAGKSTVPSWGARLRRRSACCKIRKTKQLFGSASTTCCWKSIQARWPPRQQAVQSLRLSAAST